VSWPTCRGFLIRGPAAVRCVSCGSRRHAANGRDVREIILAESADSALSQVVGKVPDISIRYYNATIDVLPLRLVPTFQASDISGRTAKAASAYPPRAASSVRASRLRSGSRLLEPLPWIELR
jgi:hypothetical protein